MLSGLNAGNQVCDSTGAPAAGIASMLSGLNAGNQESNNELQACGHSGCFNAVRLERRKSGPAYPRATRQRPWASMLSGLNAGNQGLGAAGRRHCAGASMLSGLNAGNQGGLRSSQRTGRSRFNAVRLERRKSG